MDARLAATALAVLLHAAAPATALGVNWGTQATHPLPPKAVVQVLRDNGIKKVKLFDADPAAMRALAGTGIEVMVAIPNAKLAGLAADAGQARDWVKRNVRRYDFDGGVTIKSVAPSFSYHFPPYIYLTRLRRRRDHRSSSSLLRIGSSKQARTVSSASASP
jgi:hypothetical protein